MLKNKSISGDNSVNSWGESETAFPESTLIDTPNYNTTNEKYVRLDAESTSTKSDTGKIWISTKSPNETLRTVDENKKLGVDDGTESLVSVSLTATSFEDDDWSGDKVKRSRIPKPYPLYLCPPFWFINPRRASRHSKECIANIILIGSCVYYFVIINIYTGLTTVTEYLWIAPTLVILYTVRRTRKTYKLQKVVSSMIQSLELQIKLQNELVSDINTLGEEGFRYRLEVVRLMDTISQTIQANKNLAWRNKQSVKEVEQVNKIITWKKPAITIGEDEVAQVWTPGTVRVKESSESKTQGDLVEKREGLMSIRGDLNKRIKEEREMLQDVKEGVIMLQDYNDSYFKHEYDAMKETLNKFQKTVGEVDTQVGRLEKFKGFSDTSLDDFSEGSTEYLKMLHLKRDQLRRFTGIMEMNIARTIFQKRQNHSGESGMTRATFNSAVKEVPSSVQRAIQNIGGEGNFDAFRVKSRIKVMDTKVGRKKFPGIDSAGMTAFIKAVEEQMSNDVNYSRVKNLL